VRALLLIATLFVVAACGVDAGGPAATESSLPGTVPAVSDRPDDDSIPPLSAAPLTPDGSSPVSGTVPPELAGQPEVRAAVADLAIRQGVAPDDVDVVEVREVTWRDGSLGCPQPGMNYTQALVNGQLVVLAIGDQRFEYHGGPRRPLFFCADPRPPLDDGAGSGAGST
jgi:hypothetical protein